MCFVGVLARGDDPSSRPTRRLLAGAGLLTLLMLLDDLFQLHKPVVPDATGLPSPVVLTRLRRSRSSSGSSPTTARSSTPTSAS